MLSQRISIAQDFVNEFGLSDEIQLVVDDLRSGEGDCAPQHDNPVDKAYALWPTRFYVVQGGAVQFKAEPTKEHEVSACMPMPPLEPILALTPSPVAASVQARAPGGVPARPAGRARASDRGRRVRGVDEQDEREEPEQEARACGHMTAPRRSPL